MFTRRVMTSILLSFAFLIGATAARAQDKFPSRTIRIIVPFAPGGGVDTLARLLAERMQPKMGVNVIVENRAGANGTIGGSHVLQSQPDGYTVLFSSNTHTMSKLVMNNAPYDPLTDFTPIARGGEAPLLVVISPKLPQNTLAEVAAAAQKEPDKWTAGTPALGSPSHIATLSFNRLSKANMTITPYRGTAPALTDVAGGHIQMLTDAIVVLLPMAKSGGVKALAVTTTKRSAISAGYPDCGRERRPRAKCRLVVWPLGSQGHAPRCGGSAECGDGGGDARPGDCGAARGPRRGADLQHPAGVRHLPGHGSPAQR